MVVGNPPSNDIICALSNGADFTTHMRGLSTGDTTKSVFGHNACSRPHSTLRRHNFVPCLGACNTMLRVFVSMRGVLYLWLLVSRE
eukprot:2808305-Amphidinium_carterae.1